MQCMSELDGSSIWKIMMEETEEAFSMCDIYDVGIQSIQDKHASRGIPELHRFLLILSTAI